MTELKDFQHRANLWICGNLFWIVPLFFGLLVFNIADRRHAETEAKKERAKIKDTTVLVTRKTEIQLKRKLDSINAERK